MKPHKISFVNAVTLISFGLWGYIDVDYSPTALIPVVFGVIILALNSGLKKENKTVAHIVVLLTFLILGGLFKPLMSTIESGSTIRITRVGLMMLSTLMALNNLFKSFKDLDIRVGTIIHVERIEEAIKPSYKLKIDFGELGVLKSSAQVTKNIHLSIC